MECPNCKSQKVAKEEWVYTVAGESDGKPTSTPPASVLPVLPESEDVRAEIVKACKPPKKGRAAMGLVLLIVVLFAVGLLVKDLMSPTMGAWFFAVYLTLVFVLIGLVLSESIDATYDEKLHRWKHTWVCYECLHRWLDEEAMEEARRERRNGGGDFPAES